MNLLEDLIVLEVAGVLAGPAVGMHFAELGARVIKIENKRAGGDVTRKWKLPSEPASSPISAYFCSVNWGKEHLFLDLKDPSDRSIFDGLLAEAHVLITNHLAADSDKLGLTRQRLKAVNPKLIHGHIKGFASDDKRPAFDVVLQGETGYISMTGSDAEHLAKLPIAMIDVLAAHQLKQGILLALLQQQKSNKGAYVEVCLEKAALSGLINQASNFLMTGHVAGPIGTLHPNIAPYGETFICADGSRMILAVGSDAQFEGLCQTLDAGALLEDPRFRTNTGRVKARLPLAQALQGSIGQWDRSPLLETLLQNGVPAGAVRSMDEVMASPAAQAMILEELIEGSPTKRISGNAFEINEL